ncbi:hypothetical protein AMJ39_05580 [candidate division TA06 bacterium DG_24]|uniref:Haem-binding uptake Tiki superfamily ChaN domain-containing protein n=3 Tax=Bacteria division TA06 TaxID=1156500 RepID=A0A0S8J7W6_UNCT6|nr:MAG: hypothetical protein AMJ39_05580 [candidate division TA06 bacterium DG_24]KPK67696.1 MAG: hypothetical protein AMJ82_10085 [candidate division TA06 bacterium SM23_40]KPL05839.1 MAG: hypothetical protein AMJ71_10695 [candidate division TA06 bacterium SM1_40]
MGAEAAHSALAQKAVLADYVRTHHMSPEEYVISKFEEHDVVCIGEQHRIKHDVELIQRIIPELYENGIYTLGTEFGRREDQPRIDSLLNAPAWDEALARQVTFNQSVTWGFREYVDVYRAAWQLNHGLPEGARRFRILGLGDSLDWSVIQKPEDRNDPAIMKKVWHGEGEHLWAKVVLDEVITKGEKALTYSGIHHAFTQYRQPNWSIEKQRLIRFEDRRMGNFLYREIGKRAITIYLHAPWNSAEGWEAPMVQPADGIIESVMAELEPEYIPVGFDTKGTPFGRLPGETSMYMYGYEDFTLETFCDGYIYQMPISEFRGVTPIEGFINEDNIEYARLQMPNPAYRHASIEQFNNAIAADADIPRRFANVR